MLLATFAAFTVATSAGCGTNGDTDICEDIDGNPHADCDGDGLPNAFERKWGYDPRNPDTDGDGVLDGEDDRDGDGLPASAEAALGLDPDIADTGNLGVSDGYRDTVGDGTPNMARAWYAQGGPNRFGLVRVWNMLTPDSRAYRCDPTDGTQNPLFDFNVFRFVRMDISEPKATGGIISSLMMSDIRKNKLNIIAMSDAFDVGHCTSYFELRAGSAIRLSADGVPPDDDTGDGTGNTSTDNEPEVYAPESLSRPVRAVAVQTSEDVGMFRTIEPLSVVFPAFLPALNAEEQERFELPIQYILAIGTISRVADGAFVISAEMSGVILFQDALTTKVRWGTGDTEVTVDSLMKNSAERYVRPGTDEAIGYIVRGSFRAESVAYDDSVAP